MLCFAHIPSVSTWDALGDPMFAQRAPVIPVGTGRPSVMCGHFRKAVFRVAGVAPSENGASSVDVDAALRELMAHFPSGVSVVTSRDPDGSPRGSTCTSLCSVSLRPPILLVCLNLGSSTLDALLRHESFAVNLLHSGGQHAARVFSTPVTDRFGQVTWDRTPRRGLPWLIGDAHAVAECRLERSSDVGDHTVVFGEVEEVIVRPRPPLLYGLRQYATWSESLIAQ
jgi:flavin reductase (NADH)